MAATATSIRVRSSNPLSTLFAFSFAWAFWWLALLEERDLIELPPPPVFVGSFGPELAMMSIAARQEGGAGMRSLLDRVVRWGVALSGTVSSFWAHSCCRESMHNVLFAENPRTSYAREV